MNTSSLGSGIFSVGHLLHCSQNFVSFCCCRHRWLNSILSSLDHDRIPESPAVFVLQEVTGTPFPVIVIFIHASGRSIRFRQARVYVRISQPPSDHGHLVFLQKSSWFPTLRSFDPQWGKGTLLNKSRPPRLLRVWSAWGHLPLPRPDESRGVSSGRSMPRRGGFGATN